MTKDYRLSELSVVEVLMAKSFAIDDVIKPSIRTYFVPTDGLTDFVKAFVELHYSPGVNPHNGAETAKILQIKSAPAQVTGPFWWTTPGLQENDDPKGVPVIQGRSFRNCWMAPEYNAILTAERSADLQEEANMG